MEPTDRIRPIDIRDELQHAYVDYSMSVIVGRALPDVRDGLKPVHRRILYAMHGMGLTADRKYVKCAGVVGEVLKRLHPHGDSAVYDALVRMAQPWNLRYTLVDGQGNFGSIDGDAAAAYRYTECRMTKLAGELLVDIDKETVDFVPNYDGSDEEPVVMPARLPNLLVNGAEGIAVGMATKIPPHNLSEVIDACVALIEDPEIELDELLQHVQGPDFPTGGTIYGRAGVREAYATGRGRVVVRGEVHFEELPNGRTAVVIDEIPYQVNKSRLVEQIADLVREKKLEGVADLRDESDREGMRVVVELKNSAFPEVVLNHLWKSTPLQSTFGVIMLAIVNDRPRVLTLKEMLQHYLAHRREVVLRRTRFELRKARERAHILEGFRRALDLIDLLIQTIRSSSTVGEARERLMAAPFDFSELQAQAILDMRLQRLTGMERQKIEDEYGALLIRIGELEEILGSEARLLAVVKGELEEVRDLYGDARRTRIVDARSELTMHDLVAEEDQIVTLSHAGYIKRARPDAWRMQRRGGVGKKGMTTREEDFVTSLFVANTHDTLLVFTDEGMVFPLPVYEVPEAGREAKGKPIINLVPVPEGQRVAAVVSVRELDDASHSLVFVSRQGVVKRTPLPAFRNLRQAGMRAALVGDDDALLLVRVTDGAGHLMLFTHGGKVIRFPLEDVPLYGRSARGNLGINLADGDVVVDAVLAPADLAAEADALDAEEAGEADDVHVHDDADDDDAVLDSSLPALLTVTENGMGTRTPYEAYRVQGRNGKGLLAFKVSDASGQVVGAVEVTGDDQVMLVTDTGRVIRIQASSVPLTKGRVVSGVRLMRLEPGERIVDIERLEEEAPEDAPSADAPGEPEAP